VPVLKKQVFDEKFDEKNTEIVNPPVVVDEHNDWVLTK
jgi:hypothetical protein